MMTVALGVLLGLAIGMACRWFDIPLPAPPKLVGALLVVAMTSGFVGTDFFISNQKQTPVTQQYPQGENNEQFKT